MQPTQNPPADLSGTPARVLRDAARYLARYGWIQGAYYDPTATVFTPAACVVGAVGMVCYGGPVDAPAMNHDDLGWDDFQQAVAWLDAFIAERYPARQHTDGFGCAYEFNDVKGRNAAQVIAVLNEAAQAWQAQQPASTEPVGHVDYPHEPGTLYDCPACEAACLCADGFVCVHCAILAEGGTCTVGGGE